MRRQGSPLYSRKSLLIPSEFQGDNTRYFESINGLCVNKRDLVHDLEKFLRNQRIVACDSLHPGTWIAPTLDHLIRHESPPATDRYSPRYPPFESQGSHQRHRVDSTGSPPVGRRLLRRLAALSLFNHVLRPGIAHREGGKGPGVLSTCRSSPSTGRGAGLAFNDTRPPR